MSKPKILIIEDEEIVATDIQDSVEELGYQVCALGSSGEAAVELAKKHKPDLILMDITLAGSLDGISAAAIIMDSMEIPVVYLTAHSDEATLQRAKITEPFGYVLKPFEDIELRIALEIALFKFRAKEQEQKQSDAQPELTASDQRGLKKVGDVSKNVLQFLSSSDFFSSMSIEKLSEFSRNCFERSYSQGDTVALEGDDSESAGFIVVSGRVAMIKSSASGRELIVELLGAKDPFALLAGMESQPFPLTARAQIASCVIHIRRSAFLKLIKETPDLYRLFIEDISNRLRQAHSISRALAHDRVEVRVASALGKLVDFFKKEKKHVGSECEVRITRQELADITGTTVETAIRTTRSLEDQGILDLSNAGIIRVKDVEKLSGIAST